MRTWAKLTAYAGSLVLIFGVAIGAGRLLDPDETPTVAHPSHSAEAGEHAGHTGAAVQAGGLQVTDDGYTLSPVTAELTPGRAQTVRFRIIGPDGKPVTQFTGDLHFIVVRRDLADYHHLHPTMAADGTWSAQVTVGEAGQYRAFADFQPRARAEGYVLGVDLPAPGDYRPRTLPAAGYSATVDGYTVTRAGDPSATGAGWLAISVSRDGTPVTLEPYLGSYGHLVALREGDLAYQHMHPQEGTVAGPDLAFAASVPSAGTYRLYLEFRHGGKVHLAEFTATTSAGHAHS
ncbi:hypothetical protein [Actinoplanes sp. NPDC051851]|uniref:hypothetical protein n=1 Tax=Actinoplanes sp. NPDC051851 TaxID=3154753 RepID=UPI003446BEF0